MEMTSGSDHVSVTSYQTTATILSETTEEPTTTLRYLWTTESTSTTIPTSTATSSVPVSQTSATSVQTTTTASPRVNPAAIIVPIIVVIFIILVVVLVIFLIRRRRRHLEAQRMHQRPPMPRLDEVDRTRTSEVGGPGCEIGMDSIPYQTHENGLNDYTDPPEVHHIDQADHQREESTYVLREDLNQTSAVTGTSGVLTSGSSTLGRTLKPAKTENVYQNSGFTGRVNDDAYYVNATRRSEIESVISDDDDDDGGEIVGTHLPRPTLSGDGVAPENPNGLRKNVCSIFPNSAGHIENIEAS